MSNIYYEPNEPRRIFKTPLSTNQYVQGAGRCNHCPGKQKYCDECRRELSAFKTHEAAQEYERGVQASLPPEGQAPPYSRSVVDNSRPVAR